MSPNPDEELDLVERVAAAIAKSDGYQWFNAQDEEKYALQRSQETYRRRARAAIAAHVPTQDLGASAAPTGLSPSGTSPQAVSPAAAASIPSALTDAAPVLYEALLEACLALEPIARRVFNDNGDHTINTEPLGGDVYSACYYAARSVRDALAKARGGA